MNEQKIDDNSKKKILKFSIFWVAWIVLALWIGITIPIIKKHFEIKNLAMEIEKIQMEIELNQIEWATCQGKAHDSNEKLREQQSGLEKELNTLIGFQMATE